MSLPLTTTKEVVPVSVKKSSIAITSPSKIKLSGRALGDFPNSFTGAVRAMVLEGITSAMLEKWWTITSSLNSVTVWYSWRISVEKIPADTAITSTKAEMPLLKVDRKTILSPIIVIFLEPVA